MHVNAAQVQLFKRRPDGDVEIPVRRPDGDVELQDAGEIICVQNYVVMRSMHPAS